MAMGSLGALNRTHASSHIISEFLTSAPSQAHRATLGLNIV